MSVGIPVRAAQVAAPILPGSPTSRRLQSGTEVGLRKPCAGPAATRFSGRREGPKRGPERGPERGPIRP
jgi:hypothetical protein